MFYKQAINVLHQNTCSQGILALSQNEDNYQRIWARDSVMAGIVGLLIADTTIIVGLKKSIFLLAKHQHKNGCIPSNVSIDEKKVSYGTLSGKVDATLWWIIGTCLYYKKTADKQVLDLKQHIKKSITLLESWEYNHRGLLYTPLAGNWADEYICTAYTLYDNVLYYKALSLAAEFLSQEALQQKAIRLNHLIKSNFSSHSFQEEYIYHPKIFEKLQQQNLPYMPLCFSPSGYIFQWDMAGNALAILFGLNKEIKHLNIFLTELSHTFKSWLLPVHYPIIDEKNIYWQQLNENYLYDFKNKPYHFHNGGSWMIMLGWLCLALRSKDENAIPNKILEQTNNILNKYPDFSFPEYVDTKDFLPNGKKNISYSASGYILMATTEPSKYHFLIY